jgi:hypothetical protein
MKEGGYLIFTHIETAGYLIDLLQAKVFQYIQAFTGEQSDPLAREIFGKKWNSVGHVRSFSSWVGDRLECPLVGDNINAFVDLQRVMFQEGMDLWSSWPSVSPRDLSWVKAPFDRKKVFKDRMSAYYEMLPSMIIGEPLEVVGNPLEFGPLLLKSLKREIILLGDIKGSSSRKYFDSLMDAHHQTEDALAHSVVGYRRTSLNKLWDEIGQCYTALKQQDKGMVVRLFNGHGQLSRSWGSPNFYSVWHRYS